MLKGQKNSSKQGDVGLGVAIGWFSAHGYTVSVPLTDNQDYDLIVDKDDVLARTQVKTTRYKRDGHYQVDLRTHGGNKSGTGKTKTLDPSKVEVLFVLNAEGQTYLIPTNKLRGTTAISLTSYKEFEVKISWA